jgi:hypothetical protein
MTILFAVALIVVATAEILKRHRINKLIERRLSDLIPRR